MAQTGRPELTDPFVHRGFADIHGLCSFSNRIMLVHHELSRFQPKIRVEVPSCSFVHAVTYLQRDDNITSNQVAKFSVPLHLKPFLTNIYFCIPFCNYFFSIWTVINPFAEAYANEAIRIRKRFHLTRQSSPITEARLLGKSPLRFMRTSRYIRDLPFEPGDSLLKRLCGC